ncbi:MAG: hypothetical protein H0T84_10305 [Tatlockia sp.]|nr:hypothetical protein [Tatlockia sp.]
MILNLGPVPILIILTVFIIMIFSIYVTFKYKDNEQYKKTRLYVFFTTLASLAIILVGINIMLSSISFEYNQHFSRLSKTKEAIDKLWLYPNKLIQDSSNIRPEFKASFFLNNSNLYKIAATRKTPLTLRAGLEEEFISAVMIQAWEDCISMRKYDLTPIELWLRSYITWAQSPYLKFYYNQTIYGYSHTTKIFGDLLFEYAKTLPVPVEDINLYEVAVNKLLKDKRFISLMKTLDSAEKINT